jgi:hypothetical protein
MLTSRLPETAEHGKPDRRERRDYFYFALAIIVALAVTAVEIGVRDRAATDAVLSSP